MADRARASSWLPQVVALGACVLVGACGASSRAPASDPPPEQQASPPPSSVAEASHADVLSEICPAVENRPPGSHADAVAMFSALEAADTALADARAILCASGTSDRAFAQGVFHIAAFAGRDGDVRTAHELIEASVATYAEPFALSRVASWHIDGLAARGNAPAVARDLGAAICEARAAASMVSSLVQQNGEDSVSRIAWVLADATLTRFTNGSLDAEYDVVARAPEYLACASQLRSRFEARFGELPLDPYMVRDRERAGLSPLP
jgi:hypothetical protein